MDVKADKLGRFKAIHVFEFYDKKKLFIGWKQSSDYPCEHREYI